MTQRKHERLLADESGSALVLYAILLTALLIMLVLGYGVVGAMTVRTNQESCLSVVRERTMNPATALVVKNATDPGATIARRIVDEARSCGFKDRIDVWFYEVPAHDLAPSRRIYAYETVLTSPYEVPFGGTVGIKQVDVSSSVVTSAMPYAEFSAWRPATVRTGVFHAEANSTLLTYESKALSSMPEGIQSEVSRDLASQQEERRNDDEA